MISRVTALFGRAKRVLQTEGLLPLLWQGLTLIASYFFRYETYYLYQHGLEEMNEDDLMPRVENFTSKVITTNQEADALVADGYQFRYSDGIHRERLDKGAIACCIFVGRELAHITWVATTEEAQKSILDLPFRVDYSNNEAFMGGSITDAKYRRMGLMSYSHARRRRFLRGKGAIVSRSPVAKNNIASRGMVEKSGYNMYGEARHLKILWWKSWKEKPLTR